MESKKKTVKEKSLIDKIDEMYHRLDENGKRKNKAFFSHLIRSYTPFRSVDVVSSNPDPKDKKIRLMCVFSRKKLASVEGLKKGNSSDAFAKNLDAFINSFDKDKGCFTSTTSMDQLLKGRIIALQGRDTKTYMSPEAYMTFLNWVMAKYLSKDKDIVFLVNKLANKKFHPTITVKPKKKKMYSTDNKKSTLGDLGALQELRDKFKDEEGD